MSDGYELFRDYDDRPVLKPGEVAATNDICFYYVGSWSGRVPYLLDLAAHDLNGECECKNFQIEHWPNLKSKMFPGARFRCKHLKRVWGTFGEYVLRRMLEENGQIKRRREPARTYILKRQ